MSLSVLHIIELGLGAFVATNLDNLVVFSAQLALAPQERRRRVATGQCAASLLVVAMCVALNHALIGVPIGFFAVLAAVPFVLSVKTAMALRRRTEEPALVRGFLGAALVTFAISADNAASYLPLLRASEGSAEWALVATLTGAFVLLIGLAMLIARSQSAERAVRAVGRLVEPPLYAALGVAVLFATGVV